MILIFIHILNKISKMDDNRADISIQQYLGI